jgi:alkylhydroperoxidase family enzyme
MKLTVHTLDTAPSASVPVLKGIHEQLGLVPNLAAAIAESPVALGAFDELRRSAAATSIDPIHREIAGLATGVVVDNQYGVAFHSTMLANLGVAADDIARMRSGQPPADVEAAVVHRLATEIAAGRGKVDEQTVEHAKSIGYTPESILELATEVHFAGMVGLVDNLAGRVELDAFLRPQAWSK